MYLSLLLFISCIKVQNPTTENSEQPRPTPPKERIREVSFENLKIKDPKIFNPKIKLKKSFQLNPKYKKFFPVQVKVYYKLDNQLRLLTKKTAGHDGVIEFNQNVPTIVERIYLKYRIQERNITQVEKVKKANFSYLEFLNKFLDYIFPAAYAQESYAVESYYPAKCNLGTLSYEDLWPSKGDFDFNDLVVDYNFEHFIDSEGQLKKLKAHFILKATGADFQNGFALRLPISAEKVSSVEGNIVNDWFYKINENGTEQDQDQAVIVIAGNINKLFPKWGNVYFSESRVSPFEISVTIHFLDGVVFDQLSMSPPYDPFLIVNKNRTREVHLPGTSPTLLADLSNLGIKSDKSKPQLNQYYITENNLPWAINTPYSVPQVREGVDVLKAHLKMKEWASSGGLLNTDWYMNLDGHRNDNNFILDTPSNENSFLNTCFSEEVSTISLDESINLPNEEVEVETISVELSHEDSGYNDNINKTVILSGANTAGTEKELVKAVISYNFTYGANTYSRNYQDESLSGQLDLTQKLELGYLNFSEKLFQNDEAYTQTFDEIPNSYHDLWLSFLEFGANSHLFINENNEFNVSDSIIISGDQISRFTGEQIELNLSHIVSAFKSDQTSPLRYQINFSLDGIISIKYVTRRSIQAGLTFPDPKLEQAIRSEIGKFSGQILPGDCDSITDLQINNKGITSLAGLHQCPNIKVLNLNHNQVADLSPLASLEKLERIYLKNNNVTSLSPLYGKPVLNRVEANNNPIESINGLCSGTFRVIRLASTNLQSLDGIEDCTGLTGLDLGHTNFTEVNILSNLTNLRWLTLTNTLVSDISQLATNTKLHSLTLHGTQVTDLNQFLLFPNLVHLNLNHAQVQSLIDLSSLTKLVRLYLGKNTSLGDISLLSKIKDQIQILELGQNPQLNFNDIPSNMDSIYYLSLHNNQLENLDFLGNLPSLQTLYIWSNKLTDIEKVSSFEKLKVVFGAHNQIHDLTPLLQLQNLTKVHFENNQMTTIGDVKEKWPDISSIRLTRNSLSCEDINNLYYYIYRSIDVSYDNYLDDCEITLINPLLDLTSPIVDDNLDHKVRLTLSNLETNLTEEDLLSLTSLNASNLEINTYEGLQFGTNLITLDLSKNVSTDLSWILNLPNLKTLKLNNLALSQVPDLSSLVDLESIELNDTNIGCDQFDTIQALIERGISVTINTLYDCQVDEVIYYESFQEKIANFQSQFTDFNSQHSSLEYNDTRTILLEGFTETDLYILSKVTLELTLTSECSFTGKNFSSTSGALEFSYTKATSLSQENINAEISITQGASEAFASVAPSTLTEYNLSSDTSKFPTTGCTQTETISYEFTNETDLNKFKQSHVVYNFGLTTNTAISSQNASINLDGQYDSQGTIKLNYFYEDK
jgi:LruC domain-containing protein